LQCGLDDELPDKQHCVTSNSGGLRLTPDEARELREATERLVRQGLSWLAAPADGAAPGGGEAAPRDEASGARSGSPSPPT